MVEFKTLEIHFDRKKHMKSSIREEFDNAVNQHLADGWSIINANIVWMSSVPSYVAFLKK